MITIVDYGLGNVQALLNVYKRLNIPAERATTEAALASADKIILPGVGAFDHALERLDASGMRQRLERLVLEDGVPVLGICVGMQILGESSEEGVRPGLGWIEGRVRRLDALADGTSLQMPHMGWNDVEPTADARIFGELDDDARFYFLHSYYFECASPATTAAVSHYGSHFSCAVQRANVYGVQFHPEKSHHFGTRLLQNFAEL